MDEQNTQNPDPVTQPAGEASSPTPQAEPTTASTDSPTPEPATEPVATTETAPAVAPTEPIAETGTAQMAGSEPLPEPTPSAGAAAEAPQSQTPTQGSTSQPEPTPPPVPAPASMPAQGPQGPLPFSKTDDHQENLVAPIIATPPRNLARLLLAKAQAVIQLRKQKKLLKIMTLFEKKKHITNDEVEKLLHVSDATATRYLSHLEQQGKIKQTGKTGHAVSYTKN